MKKQEGNARIDIFVPGIETNVNITDDTEASEGKINFSIELSPYAEHISLETQ